MKKLLLLCFISGLTFSAVAQRAVATITKNKAMVISFSIKAADEKTQKEIPAKFKVKRVFAQKEEQIETTTQQIVVKFVLDQADTLIIETTAPGYYGIEETLWVSCDTCEGYQHIALLEKKDSVFTDLKVNQAIRLDNVYFAQSSYELRTESYEQLVKLEKTLRMNPKLVVEIAGHTDNVGDRRLNQLLSENRAKVIVNFLSNRGIADTRLQYRGYGDSQPAARNDTEDNKKMNRRVEFKVLAN
jgi:OmpA-OmpF porin, OOP family